MQKSSSHRIVILGLPGSGKSTFAAQLGRSLKVTVHHLDRYMFLPGGKKRKKEDFIALQQQMIDDPSWIIEGCAISTLEMRFARADTVIYFRLPRFLCMWRVFKRLFFPDKTLCDTAEGCYKVFTWEIVRYIWNFDQDKKAVLDELKKKYPHVIFHTFTSVKDIDGFVSIPLPPQS